MIDGDEMVKTYILLFFIYSFLGWLMEIFISINEKREVINRGFFIGPYCPIYGCGCLLLILLLQKYSNDPLVLFALAIIICSILEYFTSWFLELIFKMRWWDYTRKKYNINGRICLETMVPFGFMGVLIVKYVNPFLLTIIKSIPFKILDVMVILLIIIFIIDFIISSNIIFNIKNIVKSTRKDSTEDIKKIVAKRIKNNLELYIRLLKSFPNFKKIKMKKERKRNK